MIEQRRRLRRLQRYARNLRAVIGQWCGFRLSIRTADERCAMQNEIPSIAKLPEFPVAGIPKLETGAGEALREVAEKGLNQAKDNFAKFKTVTAETASILESTYATASKGTADYGLKVVEIARTNTNAIFDLAAELLGARTFAQVIEISTAYTSKQMEALTGQAKELSALAQKVAAETTEPIKEGISTFVKKAA
jgi:phasin